MLALLGTFLIPIGTSSLRGLTHVLTCAEDTETPFTVVLKRNEAPAILEIARSSENTRREPDANRRTEVANKFRTRGPTSSTGASLTGRLRLKAICSGRNSGPMGKVVLGVWFDMDDLMGMTGLVAGG